MEQADLTGNETLETNSEGQTIAYDRTALPLNSWRVKVGNLTVTESTPDLVNNETGALVPDGIKDGNRITITCSL